MEECEGYRVGREIGESLKALGRAELELVETEALMKEVARRFEACVVVGQRGGPHERGRAQEVEIVVRGDSFTVVGLLSTVLQREREIAVGIIDEAEGP